MVDIKARFACPGCGLELLLTEELSRFHSDVTCDECGAILPTRPRVTSMAGGLMSSDELEQGAAAIRRMVEQIKRGE